MQVINGLDKFFDLLRGTDEAESSKPSTPPEDSNIIVDELGLKLFKKPFFYHPTTNEIALVCEPLSIHQDLASYVRKIDGKTICYYNKSNAMTILDEILLKYTANENEIGTYSNLQNLVFNDLSRDCRQIIYDENNQYSQGELITSYPVMGHYINGEWKETEITFLYRKGDIDPLNINEATKDFPNISAENVVFPIAPVIVGPNVRS